MRPRSILGALRRALRDDGGTATVEFVILFPLFALVMINSVEASILMMRGTLLDRGLDMATRELRLDANAPPSYDEFRALVCRHAGLDASCVDGLQVELRPVAPAAGAGLDASARCVGTVEEIVPLVQSDPAHFVGGAANELMLVRACLMVEPIVPNLGLFALLPRDGGGFRLVSVSAFVKEPASQAVGL